MTVALLVAGIVAVGAGLLAVLFGIPVKEFSFGNTLILVGVVGLCTGMLLMGLSAVLAELKLIARRLGPAVSGEVRVRPVLPAAMAPAGAASEPTLSPPTATPWQEDAAAQQRQPTETAPAPETPPETPRRRNLLFESTSRRERERAEAKAAEGAAPDSRPAPAAPEPATPAPPASFDDAWPKSERGRPPDVSVERRPPRTPSTLAEPAAAPAPERPVAPPRSEEQPAVTVLKSGVVDGMAYSLYSDGSIEAQMPEGMMRFASIDELRAHLDQRP